MIPENPNLLLTLAAQRALTFDLQPTVALHVVPVDHRGRGLRVLGVGGVASSTPAAVSAQVEVRVQLTRAEGARAGHESSKGACRCVKV